MDATELFVVYTNYEVICTTGSGINGCGGLRIAGRSSGLASLPHSKAADSTGLQNVFHPSHIFLFVCGKHRLGLASRT